MTTIQLGQRQPAPQGNVYYLPSVAAKSHLRITARGRAVLTVLVSVPLVLAALGLALNDGGAAGSPSGTPLESVTVMPGQSLWDVAEAVAPGTDPRDFIASVMKLNRLDSAELQPGQQLDIP